MITDSNQARLAKMTGRRVQEGFTEVSLTINHYWWKYSRISPFPF